MSGLLRCCFYLELLWAGEKLNFEEGGVGKKGSEGHKPNSSVAVRYLGSKDEGYGSQTKGIRKGLQGVGKGELRSSKGQQPLGSPPQRATRATAKGPCRPLPKGGGGARKGAPRAPLNSIFGALFIALLFRCVRCCSCLGDMLAPDQRLLLLVPGPGLQFFFGGGYAFGADMSASGLSLVFGLWDGGWGDGWVGMRAKISLCT